MTAYLTEPSLGQLDLGPTSDQIAAGECGETGYVVSEWAIGFPEVRAVSRSRALSDGNVDDSRFVGPRAISFGITIDQRIADPQLLVEQLTPYLSPRVRPRLVWAIPGSTQVRSAVVRGQDMALSIVRPKFHQVVASWVAPNGLLESANLNSRTIRPSTDVEDGRHYSTPADQYGPYYTNATGEVGRQYEPGAGIGAYIVNNAGNAVADWTAVIFGPVETPSLTINGTEIIFNRDGGLTLNGGTSVVLDSRSRTILRNNDPADSMYGKVNFDEWAWEDVRLQPGLNRIVYGGVVIGTSSSVVFSWRDSYL